MERAEAGGLGVGMRVEEAVVNVVEGWASDSEEVVEGLGEESEG